MKCRMLCLEKQQYTVLANYLPGITFHKTQPQALYGICILNVLQFLQEKIPERDKTTSVESTSIVSMWQFLYGDTYQSKTEARASKNSSISSMQQVFQGTTYQSAKEAQVACGSHWCRGWG